MDGIKNTDLVNLVIHGANGQQQMIKIVRNPNGQPLTQESVKAIVKEYMSNSSHQHNGASTESFQHKYINHSGATVHVGEATHNAHSVVVSQITPQQQPQPLATPPPPAMGAAPVASTSSASSSASASSAMSQPSPAQQSRTMMMTTTTLPGPGSSGSNGGSVAGTSKAVSNAKQSQVAAAAGGKHSKSQSYGIPFASPSMAQKKTSRRRKTDRVGKGLRHFSMKVCEKVREKGTTSYNEVADELVEEYCRNEMLLSPSPPSAASGSRASAAAAAAASPAIDPGNYDQKNIRRRVYDALNVLMAMNIISKDKKEIRWIGLPTNSAQQCGTLEQENAQRKARIEQKQAQLRELILQQVSFKSLVTRNKESEERGIIPSPQSAIQMPFIIVNTHKKTHVNCSISSDKSEYQFQFDDAFAIHDDIEVLKRMGLLLGLDTGDCAHEDIERAKTMVPKAFEKYIEIYGRGQDESLAYEGADADETLFNEDSIIMKSEQMTDEEELLDDDHYSEMSDME